jgi:uncharacterized RDD family membrane protein YckC
MQTLDRMPIVTPEGVALDMQLAGLGSRFLAVLIDMVIQILIVVLFTEIFGADGGIQSALTYIWSFLVLFFYSVLFEIRWSGRTPGKRITGLRVVTLSGGPITARASVTRNLMRILDFLPTSYIFGIVTILGSQHNQRLGDLAAGTVVMIEPARLRTSRRAKKLEAKRIAQFGIGAATPGTGFSSFALPPGLTLEQRASWDISRVNKTDVGSVRSFLERRETLQPNVRHQIALQFAAALANKVVGVPTLHPEVFLEQIVSEKERRRK